MKTFASLLALVGICAVVLVTCMVPKPSDDNSIEVTGVVTDIFEGGEKDVNFRLSGSNRSYYINRGLEQGLTINELQEKLIGREVLLVFHKGSNHLYHVQSGEREIFSEDSSFTPVSLRN